MLFHRKNKILQKQIHIHLSLILHLLNSLVVPKLDGLACLEILEFHISFIVVCLLSLN